MATARALAVSGTEAFRHQSLFLAQLDQNRAAVAEAEASLANALSDEKRAHTVTSGVISKQTIEQRETLVKTTTAKLAAARAIVEETKARLAQTEIVAPANAIVATRTATLGQVVHTGTELFEVGPVGLRLTRAFVAQGWRARDGTCLANRHDQSASDRRWRIRGSLQNFTPSKIAGNREWAISHRAIRTWCPRHFSRAHALHCIAPTQRPT